MNATHFSPSYPTLHPVPLTCTFFGIGRIPFAPGTWGSLAGVVIAYALLELPYFASFFTSYSMDSAPGNALSYLINCRLLLLSLVLFIIGTITADFYIKRTGREDPKEVVIDEVAGQLLVISYAYAPVQMLVAMAAPQLQWQQSTVGIMTYFVCFVLFRFFDILKPWPVSLADHKVKGGFGAMLDDFLAALYPAAILAALYYYFVMRLVA